MNFLSLIVYIPLQIMFVPLALIGMCWVAYRQIEISKNLGVSQTAIEILNARWTMRAFGLRDDEATAKLAGVVPNTSVFGLWLALLPLWLKLRISGKPFAYPRIPDARAEGLANFIFFRTLHFDQVIDRVIDDVEQFVMMGAGYDTRAYGRFRRDGVQVFELDQPAVQKHKTMGLDDAAIACDHVKFVGANFSDGSVFQKLVAAGFDESKKTLFLWEGVTLYLSGAHVRKTMQDVRGHAGRPWSCATGQ